MLMNCACNAISALGRSRYGRMAARAEVREIMRYAIDEAVAVARAGHRAFRRGGVICVPGMKNKLLTFVTRILPRRAIRKGVNFYNQPG